jgi:hypothetical protein
MQRLHVMVCALVTSTVSVSGAQCTYAVTVAMAVPADGSEHWGNTTRGPVYWIGSSIDPVADAPPWSPTAGVPVAQTPVISVFTAPTNSINAGEQVRLTWDVQNADSIEIRTEDNFLIVRTNQLQGQRDRQPAEPNHVRPDRDQRRRQGDQRLHRRR